jgi:hypothetical protein
MLQENTNEQSNIDNSNSKQHQEIDEQSVNKDIARLDVMNEEYTAMADKLRDEFNTALSSNPSALFSEEELEILASDSDIAKKSQMLGSKFESFRDEKLNSKQEEINSFSSELDKRKETLGLNNISAQFQESHPEVSMQELASYMNGDLTPNQLLKFTDESNGDRLKMLELVYEQYKIENKTEEDDEKLPPDLSGVNGATGDNSYNNEEDQKEYRKKIGL